MWIFQGDKILLFSQMMMMVIKGYLTFVVDISGR
jgi:hypothetical protein